LAGFVVLSCHRRQNQVQIKILIHININILLLLLALIGIGLVPAMIVNIPTRETLSKNFFDFRKIQFLAEGVTLAFLLDKPAGFAHEN
jgi:hypothetical protein